MDTLDKPEPVADASVADRLSVNLGEVRKVLRQLDSELLKERDAAEKRLIEIGPAVVPFLPEISASTSGELKVRLQRIRSQLQTSEIKTDFAASLVSLTGKLKLSQAVDEISKQTANAITVQEGTNGDQIEVNISADKLPFWEVMKQILTQTNLRIDPYPAGEGISLIPQRGEAPVHAPTASIDGPFQINVVSAQTTLPFGTAYSGQLDISLLVQWEPRLKPIYMQLPMNEMSAAVADEAPLAPTNAAAAPEIPIAGTACSAQIDLQFNRPPRSARRIEKLTGKLLVAIPSEKHRFVFENFSNGKRQSEKFGEVTVHLENARRNGSVYEVRILTEFQDAQGALDSFRGWILSNRAYLVNARQERVENVGFQTYAVTNDAVGVAFLFQINGDPNDFALVYESPGLITRQSVSFELTDIDLP